jgi:hypothetical protein
VYSRQIDGKTLTIVPTGWTYRNTFVLYGIQGKYFGRWLLKLPSEDTTWDSWRTANPTSEILP